MGVLEGLKPERVFYYFEEICKIPHGSYNVAAISDYCVSVAQSLNLEVRQDEEYNVVIRKPASEGYGEAPVLMLQGHLDMVCVKDAGVDFDFEKDEQPSAEMTALPLPWDWQFLRIIRLNIRNWKWSLQLKKKWAWKVPLHWIQPI